MLYGFSGSRKSKVLSFLWTHNEAPTATKNHGGLKTINRVWGESCRLAVDLALLWKKRNRHGPDKDMAVLAARKNVFAIRGPGHRAHHAPVLPIRMDVFSGPQVHHLHRSIATPSNG